MSERWLVIAALVLAALFGGFWFGRQKAVVVDPDGGGAQCQACCTPDRTWRPRREDSTRWGPVGGASGTCTSLRAMCDSASPEGSCLMFRVLTDSASGDTTPRK